MKNLPTIYILLLYCFSYSSHAQGVKKIVVHDERLKAIFSDYILDAVKNRAFYESKGIVTIEKCEEDSTNGVHYVLNVIIDDRYREKKYEEYAHFANHIFLFGKCGKNLGVGDDSVYYAQAIVDIGDRVYERRKYAPRYAEALGPGGKLMRSEVTVGILGNRTNETHYYLRKDGTFTKSKGV